MERATALAAASSAAPPHDTSIRHVAPSPSHAIDFASPCAARWKAPGHTFPTPFRTRQLAPHELSHGTLGPRAQPQLCLRCWPLVRSCGLRELPSGCLAALDSARADHQKVMPLESAVRRSTAADSCRASQAAAGRAP